MTAPSGDRGAPSHGPGSRISHYEILSELGRGGMGIVYRARDLRLGRDVALKCPCPDLAGDVDGRRRFMREARSASLLSHPQVVPVYEVFEAEGLPWIAMEFVEGRSLRVVLDERGPLPVAETLAHAEALAEALKAAHDRKILHRDLTPRNVLVSREGGARLTDFGLARCFVAPGEESSASTESSGVSEAGAVIGTPAYMSPEQALGKRLDARSDLFSFGSLLYEMCTGSPAFTGSERGTLLDAILNHEPAPISRHTYEVPAELERIIRKCHAKRPEERYQSTGDLLVDLRALRRHLEQGEQALEPETARPRARRAWLAAGAIAAAAALAAWGGAALLPPFARGRERLQVADSPARAFYERGLHYLMEDRETLANLDDAIQMFNRAVEADPTFAPAWATLGEAYWIRYGEWTRDDASREEASRAVRKAFSLDPDLPEAHAARARGLLGDRNYDAARVALEAAVKLRPDFDRAWANLGWACRGLGEYDAGLKAMQTAIRLRPESFRHRIRLGRFHEQFAEFAAAADAYRKAIELNPESSTAWDNLGSMYLQQGKAGDAVPAFERSLRIEESADARSNLGTAHFFLKDHEKAAECYRAAAALDPKRAVYRANLGDALKMLGRHAEARAAYLEAVGLARADAASLPREPLLRMRLGLYCARAGEEECALTEGTRAAEMEPGSAEIAFRNAVIRSILGRAEEALDWLEKGVKLGLTRAQIDNDPDLSSIRSQPRYSRIVALAT